MTKKDFMEEITSDAKKIIDNGRKFILVRIKKGYDSIPSKIMRDMVYSFFCNFNPGIYNRNLKPDNSILAEVHWYYHLYIPKNEYVRNKLNKDKLQKFFKTKDEDIEIDTFPDDKDILKECEDFNFVIIIKNTSKSIKEKKKEKSKDKFFEDSYLKIHKKFLDLSVKLNVTVDGYIDKKREKFVVWLDFIPPRTNSQGYSGIEIQYHFDNCREKYHDDGIFCFVVEFDYSKYGYLKTKIIDFLKKLIKDKPISIYEWYSDKHDYKKIY